jgi:hypothetical protein
MRRSAIELRVRIGRFSAKWSFARVYHERHRKQVVAVAKRGALEISRLRASPNIKAVMLYYFVVGLGRS